MIESIKAIVDFLFPFLFLSMYAVYILSMLIRCLQISNSYIFLIDSFTTARDLYF